MPDALSPPSPKPPDRTGVHAGLAYTLWLPAGDPWAGVVVLHGAGSCKENHHDFARACRAAGFAAVAFDQRGHGESDGALGAGALADVALMAALLPAGLPLVLRGSSMGGYIAVHAGLALGALAVIAICPAPGELLIRGVRRGELSFRADRDALVELLGARDLYDAVAALDAPLLLLHARGDERVPVAHSEELAALARHPASRLIALPGGDHRSIQHDAELQGASLQFVQRALWIGGHRSARD